MWPARAPGQLQRRSLSSWEAPELIRGIRRPASGRLTKLRSPPSARNVATCVGCTSTRLLSARRRMRRPGVRVDREARERVRERSAAHWVPALKTGTTLGPSRLLPKPQPRAESALEALAPVTTFTSAGSGHPTAPQTRKPHYSAVSEALCRTRTGDSFLPLRSCDVFGRAAESQSPCVHTVNRFADPGIHRQGSAPSGTAWVP